MTFTSDGKSKNKKQKNNIIKNHHREKKKKKLSIATTNDTSEKNTRTLARHNYLSANSSSMYAPPLPPTIAQGS